MPPTDGPTARLSDRAASATLDVVPDDVRALERAILANLLGGMAAGATLRSCRDMVAPPVLHGLFGIMSEWGLTFRDLADGRIGVSEDAMEAVRTNANPNVNLVAILRRTLVLGRYTFEDAHAAGAGPIDDLSWLEEHVDIEVATIPGTVTKDRRLDAAVEVELRDGQTYNRSLLAPRG